MEDRGFDKILLKLGEKDIQDWTYVNSPNRDVYSTKLKVGLLKSYRVNLRQFHLYNNRESTDYLKLEVSKGKKKIVIYHTRSGSFEPWLSREDRVKEQKLDEDQEESLWELMKKLQKEFIEIEKRGYESIAEKSKQELRKIQEHI